ncbi:MAG: BtrH N-terminal domain-containing protein [Myxococcales bacterium]
MADAAFQHRLAAHCETGVTSSLLARAGLQVSEAMVFGIGSGLFFVQLPWDKLFGLPSLTFRSSPATIFKKACKRLGVTYAMRQFGDEEQGQAALAQLVDQGQLVGLQTSVYWLEYVPKRFRFPFNLHNILVYGRTTDAWNVSDPVFDAPVVCSEASLRRARFAKGAFAPKGRMYYVLAAPRLDQDALARAVLLGAREISQHMSTIPFHYFGWRAIRYLAQRMEKWPRVYAKNPKDALVTLATVVRMQEEVGTGGAGFRYLGAAFLQEAGPVLGRPEFQGFSERLTGIGDRWREFAAKAAKIIKSGEADPAAFRDAAEIVHDCAVRERDLFAEVYGVVSKVPLPGVKALPAPAS